MSGQEQEQELVQGQMQGGCDVDVDGGRSWEEDFDAEFEYAPPKEWQRFYMGYKERFVDDCVMDLQVRLSQARVHVPCLFKPLLLPAVL